MIQEQLKQQLRHALGSLQTQWPDVVLSEIHLERTKDEKHGEFACNIALLLAKATQQKPRQLAELIVANIPASPEVAKIEIAGPGFINFFLTPFALQNVIRNIFDQGSAYGFTTTHRGTRIHLEYVSSNPTGPLHVGHGRSAAFGSSLARLLEAVGYTVHREYYVNDAGRQMDILATSVWLRYLQAGGEVLVFPSNGYQGDYVQAIAVTLRQQVGDDCQQPVAAIFADVPADLDAQGNGDKEAHIDGIILNAKSLLGVRYDTILDLALSTILADMRDDLAEFGVTYDEWFSERQLVRDGAVDRAIETLQARGFLYEQDGALWFRSTDFGDDKDRVLQRANGGRTYFANDIAYHLTKVERGYDRLVNVLGSDHHGYVARIRGAIEAMTGKGDTLVAPLLQFVSLYRGSEKVPMSTRSGEFITLRQLRHETGNDAARLFYLLRKGDQPIDFDLELAKSKSAENPVYYVQYAHARVCSVLRQLAEKGMAWQVGEGIEHIALLNEPAERVLLKQLARYPEVIAAAAVHYEPHQLVHFLRDLANDYHAYYNNHQFLVTDAALRAARLNLIVAVRQVIANGLTVLGITAPEEM